MVGVGLEGRWGGGGVVLVIKTSFLSVMHLSDITFTDPSYSRRRLGTHHSHVDI